jgi:biopolymer transport protein ExbD
MRRVRHGGDDADVNITPLLDIVFIMLIFFIVTATFVYEDGIEPNLPSNEPVDPDVPPPPALLLTVQEDGYVRVDAGRFIDPRSVRPVVTEFLASKPEGVVIISAEPDSRSGVMVTVLDQARQAAPNDDYSKIIVAKQGSGS